MHNKIEVFVDVEPLGIRAAKLDSGRLQAFAIFPNNFFDATGTIVRGKIKKIDKNFDAGFIDIGSDLPSFLPNISKIRDAYENKSLILEIVVPPREDKGAIVRVNNNNLYDEKGPLGTLCGPSDTPTKIFEQLCIPKPDKIYISGKEMCSLMSKFHGIQKCIKCFSENDFVIKDEFLIYEIESLFEPIYELPKGGTLIFSHTPALVAIDVNGSSKMTPEENNIIAAEEISRQIKLRNIAGVIFVDFISMRNRLSRVKLVNSLRAICRFDKQITSISSMSRTGFIEIVRQRKGVGLNDYSSETLVSMLVARNIIRETQSTIAGSINVIASPKVIGYLSTVENIFPRKLNLFADETKNVKEYEITFQQNKIR